MKTLALLLFLTGLATAQTCPCLQGDTFLAEECTGATSNIVHFVLPAAGIGWVDHRLPATFSVAGTSGTVTLGDVMPKTFGFHIGSSTTSARFQVIDTSLAIIGQCVTTAGNTYTGLPALISEDGRALTVSGRNPLYCRYTPTGGTQTDLLCFAVKGDVGGPFASGPLCQADRIEYACGTVQ